MTLYTTKNQKLYSTEFNFAILSYWPFASKMKAVNCNNISLIGNVAKLIYVETFKSNTRFREKVLRYNFG